jgi:hypothetical protein
MERQQNARSRIEGTSWGSILFNVIATLILLGAFGAVVLHELTVNSRDFAYPPNHWNFQARACNPSHKQIGSLCANKTEITSTHARRFYEELRNIESSLKWKKLYTCEANPVAKYTSEELKTYFKTSPNDSLIKLRGLIRYDNFMEHTYTMDQSTGDLTFKAPIPRKFHIE